MACTCDFEFAFDGKVMDADDGSPIEGATVATARYDLYALDSDEYNTIERADYRLTDSSGAYRVICSGLYDCAQGRIEDPGRTPATWVLFTYMCSKKDTCRWKDLSREIW